MVSSSVFTFLYKIKNRFDQKNAEIMKSVLNIFRLLMIIFFTFPFPGNAIESNTLPTGGEVTLGNGTISTSENTMTVNQQSDRMVANWETFNIGENASVIFQQQGMGSVALNRINDQNASQILGTLSANGQIFLLNPNGVFFGVKASVNVGGLIASSLNITNENFMNGNYTFEGSGGSVTNLGKIRAEGGGYVAFLSPQVKNDGEISVSGGGALALVAGNKVALEIEGCTLKDYAFDSDVVLEDKVEDEKEEEDNSQTLTDSILDDKDANEEEVSFGEVDVQVTNIPESSETEKVNVDFTGDKLISLTVEKETILAIAENNGIISADGGMVVMSAKAVDTITRSVVNNSGIVEAKGFKEHGGKIILDALDGTTVVSGTLDVSSNVGKGGSVIATGDYVLIEDGAKINASGTNGGGEILVGGSWQGKDKNIHEATGVAVMRGATLVANATDKGNGGTVVVWSDTTKADSVTRAYGVFEAKGGINGGDGGRIETSGHWLDTAGANGSASAFSGKAGEWLFDPYNVSISGASTNGSFGGGLWTPTGNDSTILNTDINGLLEGGTSVVISTYNGGAGGQIGDITINSAITKTLGDVDVTLTLNAANSIIVNQSISNIGGLGNLNVVFDADNDNNIGNGAGIIMLYADIVTDGGNLSFGTGRTAMIGGASTLIGGDVFVAGAGERVVSSNGGNVTVRGEMIVANTNGLTINSGNGDVYFYGLLNSGNEYTFVDKRGSVGFGTWGEARTEAINGTDSLAINGSYLVNITSRLENSVAVTTAGYKGAWIGAYRPDVSTGSWLWADGPETSQQFFTQTMNGSGGVTTDGYYSNFGTDEPNGSMTVFPPERVGQFFGTSGQWNDLHVSTAYKDIQANDYSVLGFVKETNLAASPVTVNAGSGTVTFDGAVGISKALRSLAVDASTTAINGGYVTTDSESGAGAQSYSGDITLGSASTILTMKNTTTNFTLPVGKNITNAFGSDASLTIKTNRGIILDDNSNVLSSSGKLNTTLHADSDANGGFILMDVGSAIQSNGGNIVLSGGLNTETGYAKGINSATGVYANGITLYSANLYSDGGNITLRGSGSTSFTEGVLGRIAHGVVIGQKTGETESIVDSGNGKIAIEGLAFLQVNNGTDYSDGVRIGTVDGTSNNLAIKVTSLSSASDAITIIGNASNSTLALSTRSSGIFNTGTIQNTGGGNVILSGIGGSSTTNATGFYNSGNILSTGNISISGQEGGSGYDLSFAGTGNIGSASGTDVITTSGNIALTGNTISIASGSSLKSNGTLTIAPRTIGTTIGIGGGAGTMQLTSDYFSTNFKDGFSSITIGNATGGAITVGGVTTFLDSAIIRNNSTISINDALTANENLSLWSNGTITQTALLIVTGSTSLTAGVSNDITLNNDSNNFGGELSVISGRNVSIVDGNAMTLGAVNSEGMVSIGTLTGDLMVTGNIITTNDTDSALVLNAGKNASAGTVTGGNIIFSGTPSFTLGAGGRATLYSGSVSVSTGLTDFIGFGSENFRYNSDEIDTNFSLGLGAQIYAIYREMPSVTVTASDFRKIYDGSVYSGGNGVTFEGLQNGDTSSLFGGTLVYGGSSQGASNPGSYNIIPSGYTDTLGYSLIFANGTLDIIDEKSESEQMDTTTITPSLEPFSSEILAFEFVQDIVGALLSSPQYVMNGTQRDENNDDKDYNQGIGAGAGSFSIDSFNGLSLEQEPFSLKEDIILSSAFQITPLHFKQTEEGMTLFTSQIKHNVFSTSKVLILPLFIQIGKKDFTSKSALIINVKENTLSAKISEIKGIYEPSDEDTDNAFSSTFMLNLSDGKLIEVTASIFPNGNFVIYVKGELDEMKMDQIVLISLMAVNTEYKKDLSLIKAIKVIIK